MSSDILLNLLLNPFFMCELKRKFLCMLLALGSVRMWKCHYPMQFSDLLSKTQPLYMRCFPCVTWLQRGAASRKPGIKIIAPALMTCDELEISWIFQPCASSCRADDLFGGSSDIVRSVNVQKAGSGAWWKTRSGHRWLILLFFIPDEASSSDSVTGIAKSDISSTLPGNSCPFPGIDIFIRIWDIIVRLQQL